MAAKIILPHLTAATVYVVIFRTSDGQWWNTDSSAFENFTLANWADYAIALTELDTGVGVYSANFPSLVAGSYSGYGYEQAGGSPAVSDTRIALSAWDWSGSAFLNLNAVGSVTGAVGSIATGGITTASFASGAINAAAIAPDAIGASELAADAALEIADALLGRSVSTIEGTASEHSLATIILATLESSISGTTWTIKRTNGSTTHFAKTLTVDAAAYPVTSVS